MCGLRVVLVSAGMFLAVQGADAALTPARVGCAPSAEAAVARILGNESGASKADGFKVVAVRTDALRQQSWAMVASCTDAARPLVAVALREGVSAQMLDLPQGVKIGDRVQVVRKGEDSRMSLSGWAEDTGGPEEMIRVKLPKFSDDDGSAAPVIRCKVVGKDLVEVVR